MPAKNSYINEHRENLGFQRQSFLREKMYELHLFTVKLIVTFSSSALIFSIGMLSLLDDKQSVLSSCYLISGWFAILGSLTLILIALFQGLGLTYLYYNNIINEQNEINNTTNAKELLIQGLVISSTGFSGVGVILILVFAYLNFL